MKLHGAFFVSILLALCSSPLVAGDEPVAASMPDQVKADWLRQAEAMSPRATPTQADAAGAVDGVKNGKYAFHTALEPNPWWQVDLGEPTAISRIVVYNRLDYQPGLHNADNLVILVSDDTKNWKQIYDNHGKYFGGITSEPPLEVRFAKGEAHARFIRLQARSTTPIFFHLDEVEIYGCDEPTRNRALDRPADQSSVSVWSTVKPTHQNGPPPTLEKPFAHFLERGRRLAEERKQAGVNTTVFDREVAEAAAAFAPSAPLEDQQRAYLQMRWAVRRLVFQHPKLDFDRILFVKRFGQETYPDVCLNHMPWVSRPGGDLCILKLAGPEGSPDVTPVLKGRLGPGHVHGMDLSFDGERIVFGYAMAHSDQPPEGWLDRSQSYRLRKSEEPIHIFEVRVDGTCLRQLTRGEWSDLDPTYLSSGDIAFVSERCGTSLQCNEFDKDETSCNLYVMRPDGSQARRLSANKDGDYLPHTLDDGMIGYTRWEYHERSWAFIQSLWTIRPDGTQADAIFKQHFTNPWSLEDARSIPGSGNAQLVAIAAGHHTLAAGPVVIVTPRAGMNDPAGIQIVTPGVSPPEGGMSGTPVPEGGVFDRDGHYMYPWALSNRAFLASYHYGKGKSGTTSEIDPTGYALYFIDVFGNKELIYRDPSISCFLPIPLRPRPRPPILPDQSDPAVPTATCVLSLASFGCEGIEPRQARYLRVAEPIGWPYDNQRGGQRYGEDHIAGEAPGEEERNLINWTPIRILGDVPLEADGSAQFQVPADRAVYFQLLDENRMELRRMRSFISFQAGEIRGCVGCHESRAVAPPANLTTSLAMARGPSHYIPAPWGDRPINFLRDVQPVLDRNCVRCHAGLEPAGKLDFSGGLTSREPSIPGYGTNRAFETINRNKLVVRSLARLQDSSITPPLAFGSHRSKLISALKDAQHAREVQLSADDRLRLVMWVDANAPYHDSFVNKRPDQPAYDLAADRELQTEIAAVHTRRCASCHDVAAVSRLDWIRLDEPDRSRFLRAPLAKSQGGSAECSHTVYADTQDRDYQAVRTLVEAAVQKAWRAPRRDLISVER